MAGKIILCIVTISCAILFFAIGVYAKKIAKPMWFWSGVDVDASTITDVKQYNHDNGAMWQRYSLWYFASALAALWSPILSVVFLILGCTVGIALLVYTYKRICRKYQAPQHA